MEILLQSLVTGAFTLTAAFGGYALSSRQEKRHRAQDQSRADNNSQLQAVAAFLRAYRGLTVQAGKDMDAIHPTANLSALRPDQQTSLISIRLMYFNNLLQELETLDLYLYDPFVREPFQELQSIINDNHKFFREKVGQIDKMSPSEQTNTIDRFVVKGVAVEEVEKVRAKLIEAARNRLRLTSVASDEHLGMYTPYD